jgi:aryl-alcohol dehydrogenase-like predicted oxidoreductase
LLAGTMDERTSFADDDWRSQSPLFQGEAFHRNLDTVRELGRFARERGHTVSQLAIAWTLANPAVEVAIVGARRAAHIEDSVGAADFELGHEDLAEVDRIMSGAVTVAGPSPESV